MAPLIDPVQIDGLRQIVRALRAVSSDAPKALRIAANNAADLVVVTARAGMPVRSGKARKSVKAKSTRTAARVSEGGNKAPYTPWLDYGGKVGRNNSATRPFIADGRYVYPAYRAKRGEFEKLLRDELHAIVSAAGLEMT